MAKSSPHALANMATVNEKGGPPYVFSPRALNIVWGSDSQYWNIKDNAAELVQVCWLQVTGSTVNLEPKLKPGTGTYEVIFKVALTEGAFGWTNCPVRVMAKPGKTGTQTWQRLDMSNIKTTPSETACSVQIQLGEGQDIYFGLYEVWSGRWKGGLVINGVEIKKVN